MAAPIELSRTGIPSDDARHVDEDHLTVAVDRDSRGRRELREVELEVGGIRPEVLLQRVPGRVFPLFRAERRPPADPDEVVAVAASGDERPREDQRAPPSDSRVVEGRSRSETQSLGSRRRGSSCVAASISVERLRLLGDEESSGPGRTFRPRRPGAAEPPREPTRRASRNANRDSRRVLEMAFIALLVRRSSARMETLSTQPHLWTLKPRHVNPNPVLFQGRFKDFQKAGAGRPRRRPFPAPTTIAFRR